MRGALLRNALLRNSHFSRNLHFYRNIKPATVIHNGFIHSYCKNYSIGNVQFLNNFPSRMRFFSSEHEGPDPDSKPGSDSSESKPEGKSAPAAEIEDDDVANEELKRQIVDCLKTGKRLNEVTQSIAKKFLEKDGAALKKLSDEISATVASVRYESDDSDGVTDIDSFESDPEGSDTDDEVDKLKELCLRLKMDKSEVVQLLEKEGLSHLLQEADEKVEVKEKYYAGPLLDADSALMKKMTSDPLFNMDDKKWDEMISKAMEQGMMPNIRECEFILEDMLSDKPLPDIKSAVVEKFNEISDRVERGELSVEEGYDLFKEFENQIVKDCSDQMEAEGTTDSGKDAVNDPSVEGPTLRWETRVVFLPGGESWHPKNRKVKLATTVKEYGLTKPQFARLRALVGKRYNPGKDELTIISERFEHREENRKDCLRTLLALMEEARKAEDLVHEARVLDIKGRLKANPEFMQRLQSKKQAAESKLVSA